MKPTLILALVLVAPHAFGQVAVNTDVQSTIKTISSPSVATVTTSTVIAAPTGTVMSNYLTFQVTPGSDALNLTLSTASVAPAQVLTIMNVSPSLLFFLLGAPVPPGSGVVA